LWHLRWSHLLTAATMAVTLFFFGAFMLLQINLQQLLKGWGDQIQITAYLSKTLGADDISAVLARVQAWPEVERVRMISQEQAWRDFQTALGAQSSLLDGLPRDVLPASLEISLKPVHRDSPMVEQLAVRLRGEKEFASVEYPQEWVERLGLIVLAVQWAKWSLGGLLFLAAFLIVGSAVKLALLARHDEIEIMQLVGAPEELIQAPFVLVGMIQGLVGGVLSVAMLWGLFALVRSEFATLAAFMAPLVRPQFLDPESIVFILASGALLGAAGSLFSLRRFLRTWKAVSHPV
ncbi:MAG: cell division protein FtsX, partial [Candidatus Binatia bacterium]